jgi:hypothetical protein
MATQKELNELIGKMVADPAFRASLMEDPEKAIKAAGYDLTEEQIAGLKQTDLKALTEGLDERLSKSASVCWSAECTDT